MDKTIIVPGDQEQTNQEKTIPNGVNGSHSAKPEEIPAPGRSLSFQEAKKASFKKLDEALTRLSK